MATSANVFDPRIDILPPPQRAPWGELRAIPAEFVLYGGTALALHLGHRQSVDFNFFGPRAFAPEALTGGMSLLADAVVTQLAPSTLSVILDRGGPVRLSFFGLPRLARLRPPLTARDNGLRVASLLDLAGTKASVVQQRAEAKDYLDVDAILQDGRIGLPEALAAAGAIHGRQFSPLATLKALSYFEDGDLHLLPGPVKQRLAAASRAVNPDRLPGPEASPP